MQKYFWFCMGLNHVKAQIFLGPSQVFFAISLITVNLWR